VNKNKQTETVKFCFRPQIIIQTGFFSKIRWYFAPKRVGITYKNRIKNAKITEVGIKKNPNGKQRPTFENLINYKSSWLV
jgi:hypothetical protein